MHIFPRSVFAVTLACVLSACGSHSSRSSSTDATQPVASPVELTSASPSDPANTASADTAASAASSPAEEANAPSTSETAASPAVAADGQCPLLSNDQVGEVMHLTVKSVDIGSDSGHCDFLFKENAYIGLSIKYSTQDGPREVTSLREASKGVTAIAGSIAKTIGAPAVPGVTTEATLPPGVAKVGDDQVFSTPGMTTIFAASKGDAYVEVMGGVMADGVSRWVALPEIARRVLASR